MNLMRLLTSDVHVMQRGNIVEAGPTAQVLDAPRHSHTQRLVAPLLSCPDMWTAVHRDVGAVIRSITATAGHPVNWCSEEKT